MINFMLVSAITCCTLFSLAMSQDNLYWSCFFGGMFMLTLALILVEAIENISKNK